MDNTLGIASLAERTAITDSGLDMAQLETMTPAEQDAFEYFPVEWMMVHLIQGHGALCISFRLVPSVPFHII